MARCRELYADPDPDVIACTQQVLHHLGERPSMTQPSREQLLAALAK
jgi:hypothetical protein